MKEFLSRRGLVFTVRRVDEDPEAYAELLARGYRVVPLTCVGSRGVTGFDESALLELIAPAPDQTEGPS